MQDFLLVRDFETQIYGLTGPQGTPETIPQGLVQIHTLVVQLRSQPCSYKVPEASGRGHGEDGKRSILSQGLRLRAGTNTRSGCDGK